MFYTYIYIIHTHFMVNIMRKPHSVLYTHIMVALLKFLHSNPGKRACRLGLEVKGLGGAKHES